jgi:Dipeptidyl aminopeptidases/acylaminoacyl-peptidases
MSSTRPSELFIYSGKGLRKVTSFNDELLKKSNLQVPERFTFKASDGQTIEGWVLKPANFKDDKKYPAVLYIHGGPATTYGESFQHEFYVLSESGFGLVYMNPRGSAGYGESFKDLRGKYGTRDYQDLMEGLDYVIKNFSFIDEKRLGVAGGSYGGFMTNWIIGHTERFKAAVSQRSISNWISFYGTSDIGYYFAEDQIGGDLGNDLWKDDLVQVYWDRSPLKYAYRVKTPTLLLHSDEDYRCWIDQAYQMFTALKLNGVQTKLVIFHKENHDLSRKGKPKNRIERLNQIISWFKTYL